MTKMYDADSPESALASALIPHVEYDRARDAILESLDDPSGTPFVLCLGVPGFGKSLLLRDIEREVMTAHVSAMRADPNLVPVVRIEAFAPDAGRSFGWRESHLQLLERLGERGVELRIGDVMDREALVDRRGASKARRSERELQSDVIDALVSRGTKVLLIDEIEHIAYQKDVARYGASIDILKTIGNATGVRIVAAGSYEGLGFRNVSGQVLRRRRFVHLRRYHAGVDAEYAEYTRVVGEMLALIGFDGDPATLVPTLYRQSLGAIGTTAELIMQAEHAARWHDQSLLHGIARVSRAEADIEVVAAEIIKGEATLAPAGDARSRLDGMLALGGTVPVTQARPPARRSVAKPRPGRRKPARDLVGTARVR